MRRVVAAEFLDELPPASPAALGSRADLRRLNLIMGHARIFFGALRRYLADTPFRSRPWRVVELGAGDGTLLLRVARRAAALGVKAEVTLLDKRNLVAAETRQAFARLGWPVDCATTDVFAWLDKPFPTADLMIANLFLHHFPERSLAELLRLARARTSLFMACEPRRSALALFASRALRLIGCNEITRHDAVVSVRAGFAGGELSASWAAGSPWQAREHAAGLFSHFFMARRNG